MIRRSLHGRGTGKQKRANLPKATSSHANKAGAWKEAIRNKLEDDRFNDATIVCSDGKSIRCQSFMLRVHSDVLDEMWNNREEDTVEAPKFRSTVMARIKEYCHLGEVTKLNDATELNCVDAAAEMHDVMDTVIAADYYNIDGLGDKCLEFVRSLVNEHLNLVFLIAAKYGLNYENEHRTVVKATIHIARTKLCKYRRDHLNHPSIRAATSVQDTDTLRTIVKLLPFNTTCPLLRFQFLEKWMILSSETFEGKEKAPETESLTKRLVKEMELLKHIGAMCPRYLVAKDGPLRSSVLVDAEALVEAIDASPLEQQCRMFQEKEAADKGEDSVVPVVEEVWC
ncbi:expressed unknown protein [Seminavis robusta]|uniref:BTB domain-containing protein n=1 Tax=Seminavis robusta TaxID=568900 RepID=A0A9N8EP27_9STRA|nr:expressed unknown protein [Seminavis robusta]|eukprot:Sro1563_g282690.1 n/a (340) ;mRNA; f:11773-12792